MNSNWALLMFGGGTALSSFYLIFINGNTDAFPFLGLMLMTTFFLLGYTLSMVTYGGDKQQAQQRIDEDLSAILDWKPSGEKDMSDEILSMLEVDKRVVTVMCKVYRGAYQAEALRLGGANLVTQVTFEIPSCNLPRESHEAMAWMFRNELQKIKPHAKVEYLHEKYQVVVHLN